MTQNIITILVTALVPLIVGSIWYNPKVMGSAWIKTTGLSEEQLRQASMPKIFGFTLLLSLMLATTIPTLVIHQMAIGSIMANEAGMKDPNSDIAKYVADFMARFGQNFRTFKHGAFHGTLAAIFFALPILGINALFERKSAKYIFIHTGYWIITLALMGGIVCQFIQL